MDSKRRDDAPNYLHPDDAQAFLESLQPVSDIKRVVDFLQGKRGLNAGAMTTSELAYVPRHATDTFEWARPFAECLVTPLWTVGRAEPATFKRRDVDTHRGWNLPKTIAHVKGTVMANGLARRLLVGEVIDDLEGIVVVEGDPDFWTWVEVANGRALAVFGIFAGSWSPKWPGIADVIPHDVPVYLRTDPGDAGNKYAADIAHTLTGRELWRLALPDGAGDENDRHQKTPLCDPSQNCKPFKVEAQQTLANVVPIETARRKPSPNEGVGEDWFGADGLIKYARRTLAAIESEITEAPEGASWDTVQTQGCKWGSHVAGNPKHFKDQATINRCYERLADAVKARASKDDRDGHLATLANSYKTGLERPISRELHPPKQKKGGGGDRHKGDGTNKRPVPNIDAFFGDWRDELKLNKFGAVANNIPNVTTILQKHPEWQGVLAFNRFSLNVVKRKEPPWHEGEALEAGTFEADQPWSDLDTTRLRAWMSREYDFSPGKNDAHDCAEITAQQSGFHPVKDYLDDLEWDGKERLPTWLIECCGAPSTDYVKAVSTWWMISAVARIYKPGCKVDHVLILEGNQGLRKSKILASLVPTRRWFFDSEIDLGNKDAYIVLQGQWIIELAELHALSRREANLIKAFFTSQEDKFRAPYERTARIWPRQCVFAGTVNPEGTGGYLRDATGNRRFWPVPCTVDRVDMVEEMRDQLWAEAVHRFKAGERWWPKGKDEHDMCRGEQADRYEGDTWEEKVMHWLHEKWTDGEETVTTAQILSGAIGIPPSQQDKGKATRIGKIMSTTQTDAWERGKIKDKVTGKWVRGYKCVQGPPPPKWDAGLD